MRTHSEENYLKAIYTLAMLNNEKVSATSLATALGHNPASVLEMLRKLSIRGMVDYDKVAGARLTAAGEKFALQTIRRHRLWEMFLNERLDYTWDEVHEIAEQLEHVGDETLADRLDKYLGFPRFDPHGEAIPRPDGRMPALNSATLNEMESGRSCKVVSVKDTSKAFLRYLLKLNIGIGTSIRIVETIEFDRSMIILVDDLEKVTVSEKFAGNIYVA